MQWDNVVSGFRIPAPSSPPERITVTAVTPTSITITWQRVPCVDRNTEVTQYVIRVGQTQVADTEGLVRQVHEPRVFTVMELIPQTGYTIGVAAQRQDFSASPVIFLAGVEADVTASTQPVPGMC